MVSNAMARLVLVVMAGAIFAGLGGCDKHAADKQQIRQVWEQVHRVCQGRDGSGALKVYSQKTFDHYGRLVRIALDGTAEQVFREQPTAIGEILLMRCRKTRKQLQGLDGRQYVALAVSEGWWAQEQEPWAIRSIKISGDFAKVILYDQALMEEYRAERMQAALSRRRRWRGGPDKPPEYAVTFVREDDGWKLDETSVLPHLDALINEWCAFERRPLRDLLMREEEAETGKKVPMSIWDPMKK